MLPEPLTRPRASWRDGGGVPGSTAGAGGGLKKRVGRGATFSRRVVRSWHGRRSLFVYTAYTVRVYNLYIMKRYTLAAARAHFAEILDDAEHRKRPTLITRNGKPAAVISPVPRRKRPPPMTEAEVTAYFEELANLGGDPSFDAVADLIEARHKR